MRFAEELKQAIIGEIAANRRGGMVMIPATEAARSQQVWGTFDRVRDRLYDQFQNVEFDPMTGVDGNGVTGWSVRFTTMSKYEQDQFIARDAHGL